MPDFVPSSDSEFDSWMRNLCQYIVQKTSGPNPLWKHIPAAEITAILKAQTEWEAAYLPCLKPHNEVQTAHKNETRTKTEKTARLLKHRYIDFRDEVSEADLKAMGFKPRDTPTFLGEPVIRPELIVENTRNRFEHLLKALNPESQTFRKPAGANGVCYAYQIGGEKPASGAEIGKTRFSRKTSLVVTHIEADKGKRVFYSVCYENAKGEKGPWSQIEEAYIG